MLPRNLHFSNASLYYLLAFFSISTSKRLFPLRCQFILFTSIFQHLYFPWTFTSAMLIHTIYQHFLASLLPKGLHFSNASLYHLLVFFSIASSHWTLLLQCQFILFTSIFQHPYFLGTFTSPMLVYIIYQHFLTSMLPRELYLSDASLYYLLAFFSIPTSQGPSLLQCQFILFTSIFQHPYFLGTFTSPMLVYIIYQHLLASLLPRIFFLSDASLYYLLAFFNISTSKGLFPLRC